MKYSLRSLMIAAAIVPPVVAAVYYVLIDQLPVGVLVAIGWIALASFVATVFDFPASSLRQ